MESKTLIVIATNNGIEHLKKLFASLDAFGCDADITVIDTGSRDGLTKSYVYGELTQARKINYASFIEGGYCTRAWLHAYQIHREYEQFVFLHDSVVVKSIDWLDAFTNGLTDDTVNAWLSFGMAFDNDLERDYITNRYGNDLPPLGIFGPIFASRRASLMRLEALNLLPTPPENKLQECGWERGWAMAFKQANMNVHYLNAGVTAAALDNDEYAYLTKVRPSRI